MRKLLCLFALLSAIFSPSIVLAEKGFSIEAGLLFDRPSGAQSKPYTGMSSGFGYMGNIGYDFFERGGLELGVMHTTHDYDINEISGAVTQESADKTTIFLKARGIPYQHEKFEIIVAAGLGFFDLSGMKIIQDNSTDEDYSGLGFTGNLDFRYNITEGLAVSLYLGGNLVNYNRYELLGIKTTYPGKLPGGDSFNWGLTIFHRIGIPQL
jgi:hypothetical protein